MIELIRRMWRANPTWGSRRIQAELAKLGLQVCAATIRKYRPKGERGPPSQTWRAFLRNHTKQLVAVDFFTVPTVRKTARSFCSLFYGSCFFGDFDCRAEFAFRFCNTRNREGIRVSVSLQRWPRMEAGAMDRSSHRSGKRVGFFRISRCPCRQTRKDCDS